MMSRPAKKTARISPKIEELSGLDPVPLMRQKHYVEDPDLELDAIERGTPAEERERRSPTRVEPEPEPEPEPESGPAKKEPTVAEMLHMYMQTQLMASSTGMTDMNAQLQELGRQVAEKQQQMQELRSKMVHTQGAISMLHGISAKMRELNLNGGAGEAAEK